MSNYFKLKRPFVSKTDKLPEGVIRNIAQLLKTIENTTVKMANAARSGKVVLKKCAPLQAKVDKEQNADKQAKLNEQLLKLKDEYTDCLIDIIKALCDASVAFGSQIETLGKADTTFLSEDQLKKVEKELDQLSKASQNSSQEAADAAASAADAEREAEDEGDDN